jgi:hypothetical protein
LAGQFKIVAPSLMNSGAALSASAIFSASVAGARGTALWRARSERSERTEYNRLHGLKPPEEFFAALLPIQLRPPVTSPALITNSASGCPFEFHRK